MALQYLVSERKLGFFVKVKELFGYDAEEFTSGKISYAEVIHPDDLRKVQEEVKVFGGGGRKRRLYS